MKALVYGGPGEKSWIDKADPVIADPRDAIIQVDAVTICGTDLHILKGDVPETRQLDVGPMVTHRFAPDDFEQAYRVFADAADTGALKVVLSRS